MSTTVPQMMAWRVVLVLGAMHYGSGILTAAMVGWFADGTPWTMARIMCLAGLGGLATSMISSRIQTHQCRTQDTA